MNICEEREVGVVSKRGNERLWEKGRVSKRTDEIWWEMGRVRERETQFRCTV